MQSQYQKHWIKTLNLRLSGNKNHNQQYFNFLFFNIHVLKQTNLVKKYRNMQWYKLYHQIPLLLIKYKKSNTFHLAG